MTIKVTCVLQYGKVSGIDKLLNSFLFNLNFAKLKSMFCIPVLFIIYNSSGQGHAYSI